MAKLVNKTICLEISVYHCYVEVHQTDEFHYDLSLSYKGKSIINIDNGSSVDFELDDYRLSDVFENAINARASETSPSSWEGGFYLTVSPYEYSNNGDDEWYIKIELDSLYYGSSIPETLGTVFKFFTSTKNLIQFSKELKDEENQALNLKNSI